MSGVCSKHQTHDPTCGACTAIPLTEEQRHYYRGWDAAIASMKRHGWAPVEVLVLDAYEALERAARGGDAEALKRTLAEIDHLRELHRGFGRE